MSEEISDELMMRVAASIWTQMTTLAEVARTIGVSKFRLSNHVNRARRAGDKRFPQHTGARKLCRIAAQAPPPPREGDDLFTVAKAFLRERHPGGPKYTPECIFKAQRDFPPGFQFRKVAVDLSQRELTNRIQAIRASA